MWCDSNPKVLKWGIEEVTIKYFNPVKQKPAKYIIDFYVEFDDARELLIEVKPHKETIQPVLTESKTTKTGKPTMRFRREQETFAINQEKWRMAKKIAAQNGMEFAVFTEHTLDKLGIRRLAPKTEDKETKKTLFLENKRWRKKPPKAKRPKSSQRKKK